jgi:hypothetical protein
LEEWIKNYDGLCKNFITLGNALAYINRLEAENENLKDILYDAEGVNLVNYWYQQCKIAENGCRNFEEELKTAKADIKKLTSGKCVYLSDDETTEYCVEGPCPKYKTEAQIKAEAYKEFAERLKKGKQYSVERHENIVPVAVIDWILKEMVGE